MKRIGILLSVINLAVFPMRSLSASPLTDRGLRLSLNTAGLDILAKEIKKNVLNSVERARLPDIKDKVDYDIDVEVKDLEYSVNFTHLRIFPQQGSLGLELGVKDIKIEIPSIKASKKVLVRLSTTCRDTQIKIAQSKVLTLSASLPLAVDQNNIETKIEHVQFQIPDDQYMVVGPGSCSGALGTGTLIKSVARNILKKSKQNIVDAVRDNLGKAEKGLEQELNRIAHQTLDLRGSVLPGLPKIDLALKLSPFDVMIDNQQLGIEFAIDTSKNALKLHHKNPLHAWPSWSEEYMGAIGVNPELLNEAIADWLSRQPNGFYLDDSDLPALAGFLRRGVAGNAWPNLALMNLTSDDLRLKLNFRKDPRIFFDESSNNLHIVANVVLTFEIELNGKWVDYYHLTLDLAAFAFIRLDGDLLEIGFTDVPNADWSGQFADGFDPELEHARREVLDIMVYGIMQGLYDEGAFLSLWIPTLYLGGKYVKSSALYYESPYISAALQASDEP